MDEAYSVYVIIGNSDRTEGRGSKIDAAFFHSLEKALEVNRTGKYGVQGVPNTRVILRVFYDNEDGTTEIYEEDIWGYHKAVDGTYRYGMIDDSDYKGDPEYDEYIRLKGKFGGTA